MASSPPAPSLDLDARPSRFGIVDLGSNTARLVVYECRPPHWYRLVDSIREPVRLAEGMQDDGSLQPEALERARAALWLFADYARAAELDDVHTFATSAVREATNRDLLLDQLPKMGLSSFEVLSGEQEAALGVCAVANAFDLEDAWVMDLGGGSAQISLMRGGQFVRGTAFPLGAVRLFDRFLAESQEADGKASRESLERLDAFVESELAQTLDAVAEDDLPILAMGGTVRNLARIAQKEEDYPLPQLHSYPLSYESLDRIARKLSGSNQAERERTGGLSLDRADIIVPGARVFRHVLERSGRSELLISGVGVREGAFFRRFLPEPHRIEDVRKFAVGNLFSHYPQPRLHTEHVRRLAERLFEGLTPLHNLDDSWRELLTAAATLHDIGMTIGYYRHHRHGAFLVSSSALHGFDHREHALITLLVHYHRKGEPSGRHLSPLLRSGDLRALGVLSVCLRMAEHLERSRSARIDEVG
ncbi:MAG: Ppx/GppA phosphatase family protein, partial [Acidobacteriota bacterium]